MIPQGCDLNENYIIQIFYIDNITSVVICCLLQFIFIFSEQQRCNSTILEELQRFDPVDSQLDRHFIACGPHGLSNSEVKSLKAP